MSSTTLTILPNPDDDSWRRTPAEERIVEGIVDPIGVFLLAKPLYGPRARIIVAVEGILQHDPPARRELGTAWKETHWDRIGKWPEN